MKKYNILKWIIFSIAVAINLFIIVNSCLTGEASTAASNSFIGGMSSTINAISPGSVNSSNKETFVMIVRKLFGHFGLFGLSSCFTTWACYLFLKDTKVKWFLWEGLISFGIGFFVAGLTELIQLFIPGRSGSIIDVLIDATGYLIGVLLVILIIFAAKKPIFTRESKMKSQAE